MAIMEEGTEAGTAMEEEGTAMEEAVTAMEEGEGTTTEGMAGGTATESTQEGATAARNERRESCGVSRAPAAFLQCARASLCV